MFCPKCGKEIADDSKHCSACGALVGESSAPAETKKKMSGFAITGFVVSLVGLVIFGLVCGIIGAVFSLVALKLISKDETLKGNGLAIAGLVISIVDIVVMIVYMNVM